MSRKETIELEEDSAKKKTSKVDEEEEEAEEVEEEEDDEDEDEEEKPEQKETTLDPNRNPYYNQYYRPQYVPGVAGYPGYYPQAAGVDPNAAAAAGNQMAMMYPQQFAQPQQPRRKKLEEAVFRDILKRQGLSDAEIEARIDALADDEEQDDGSNAARLGSYMETLARYTSSMSMVPDFIKPIVAPILADELQTSRHKKTPEERAEEREAELLHFEKKMRILDRRGGSDDIKALLEKELGPLKQTIENIKSQEEKKQWDAVLGPFVEKMTEIQDELKAIKAAPAPKEEPKKSGVTGMISKLEEMLPEYNAILLLMGKPPVTSIQELLHANARTVDISAEDDEKVLQRYRGRGFTIEAPKTYQEMMKAMEERDKKRDEDNKKWKEEESFKIKKETEDKYNKIDTIVQASQIVADTLVEFLPEKGAAKTIGNGLSRMVGAFAPKQQPPQV